MTQNPTTVTLQPRGLGELLDQAIRLYRSNFVNFIGIMAMVQIPIGLMQMIVSTISLNGLNNISTAIEANPTASLDNINLFQVFGGAAGSGIVSLLSFILVNGIGTAALTRAIADGYLGEPVDIIGSYEKIGKRWGTLLGALALGAVVSIIGVLWMIIPCIGWFTAPGFLGFLSLAVMPLLGPIVVLENIGPMDALRRAWDLARARIWWLIGYVAILYVFNLLVVSGPVSLLSILFSSLEKQALLTGGTALSVQLTTVIQQFLAIILGILYQSLQATAITLAYFDLRVRLEGFDLAVQTLSQDQSIVEQLHQAPVGKKTSNLIDQNDIIVFAVLSIIVVVFYALIVGASVAAGISAAGGMGG